MNWRIRGALIALIFLDQVMSSAGEPKGLAGVVIHQEGAAELNAGLRNRITTAPVRAMKGYGIVGGLGGARVRVFSTEPQEILLPIPQMTEGQVPICYSIASTPADAVLEYRLQRRDGENFVVAVRLAGRKQEVQLAWSCAVLVSAHSVTPNSAPAGPYRAASPCVQAEADEIQKLAAATWPTSGKPVEFAANIQRHIRDMKRLGQPRSLDARSILKSGDNSICTANANLAAALMRAKGVACRSVAVIPSTSQRLEMHRIVEYYSDDRWIAFDPSSLHANIPTKPWQNLIMARTTLADEQLAMKPRMGVAVGCPYGHEVELLTPGVNLALGQDFFWTMAKPLAEFEATQEAARLAGDAWMQFLKTGRLTEGQRHALSATNATELVEQLQKSGAN
jgi:hypothetical protein